MHFVSVYYNLFQLSLDVMSMKDDRLFHYQ